jgi:hypothetical protein
MRAVLGSARLSFLLCLQLRRGKVSDLCTAELRDFASSPERSARLISPPDELLSSNQDVKGLLARLVYKGCHEGMRFEKKMVPRCIVSERKNSRDHQQAEPNVQVRSQSPSTQLCDSSRSHHPFARSHRLADIVMGIGAQVSFLLISHSVAPLDLLTQSLGGDRFVEYREALCLGRSFVE